MVESEEIILQLRKHGTFHMCVMHRATRYCDHDLDDLSSWSCVALYVV